MKHPLKHKRRIITKKRGHSLPHLWRELECLKMTSADLQAAVEVLKAAVIKVASDVAALKAKPELITQDQLDSVTADVQAAGTTLNGL